MTAVQQFISVDEALVQILGALRPIASERRAIAEARGMVLGEDVVAPSDSPPFDNSAMDGFAFAHSTDDAVFDVVGESAAGRPFSGEVLPRQAVRIMTGAAVPAGCDTVAMREDCTADGASVRVDLEAVSQGDNIRARASYMAAGSIVLSVGCRLSPSDIGLLASFGKTSVSVKRRPRVAVLTTGTELVEPGEPLGDGQIYNSNAYMLRALVEDAGAIVTVAPIVEDDRESTRAAILSMAESTDLLLTVGGVSVGDYDFVRDVLEELAAPMEFWKVRMKPGKPLAFGVLGARPAVIGLPGNPMSAFVAFHVFVRPALDALQGHQAQPYTSHLRLESAVSSTPKRREYVLGHVAQGMFVPHPNLSSGNVVAMHGCDALGIIEEGVSSAEAGQKLDVIHL